MPDNLSKVELFDIAQLPSDPDAGAQGRWLMLELHGQGNVCPSAEACQRPTAVGVRVVGG